MQVCSLGGPSAVAGPFHNIRAEDVPRDFLREEGPAEFTADLQALLRTMKIAARVGAGAVLCYSLSCRSSRPRMKPKRNQTNNTASYPCPQKDGWACQTSQALISNHNTIYQVWPLH